MTSKRCTECHIEKDLGDFHKNARCKKTGRQPKCKTCRSLYSQINKEAISEKNRIHRSKNKDRLLKTARDYYWNNREAVLKRHRNYPEEYRAKKRAYVSEYQKRNREARNKYSKEYIKARRKRDPNYRAVKACRTLLWNTLLRTGQSSYDTSKLGYTKQDLINTITARFKPGMSWNNHGKWHIDHKIPVAHFMRKDEIRPHIINALCNLEPVWAEDNRAKGDTHPFK